MSRPLSFRTDPVTSRLLFQKSERLGVTRSELLDHIVQCFFEEVEPAHAPINSKFPVKIIQDAAVGQAMRQVFSILKRKVREIQKIIETGAATYQEEERLFQIILQLDSGIGTWIKDSSEALK